VWEEGRAAGSLTLSAMRWARVFCTWAMSLDWWLLLRYQSSCLLVLSRSHTSMNAMPTGPAVEVSSLNDGASRSHSESH